MFRNKIEKGDFVITCEVLTPLDLNFDNLIGSLTPLRGKIDSFNLPFCPLGRLRPHSLLTAQVIMEHLKINPILHLAARHQTTLGFEATLLFCQAVGIENILCITGDAPTEGEGNYRLNSIDLLNLASHLNKGISFSHQQLPVATDFLVCAAYNPNRINIRAENLRLKRKVENGAKVFFTQPVFNTKLFLERITEAKEYNPGIKIIAGLSFLYKKKIALRLQKFLGIPYKYIEALGEEDEAGLLLKTAQAIRNAVDGFYIIPIGHYDQAERLISRFEKNGIA